MKREKDIWFIKISNRWVEMKDFPSKSLLDCLKTIFSGN